MSGPKRIQMTRQRPWRADNPDAVRVDRSTKWGNPWRTSGIPGSPEVRQQIAVDRFRADLLAVIEDPWGSPHDIEFRIIAESLPELRGRDLACWCKPGDPCHADVLLELANLPAADGSEQST